MTATKFAVPPASFKTELAHAKPADAKKATGATAQANALMIPVDQIEVLPDFNVRVRETEDYKAEMEELKAQIAANGFYQHKPLAGYAAKVGDKDVVYLEDGHRRLEAVQALNFEQPEDKQIKTLPVVVSAQPQTVEDMLTNLIVSNSGKPLIPYEKGLVVKRLVNLGVSKKDIATRLGYTPRYVDDLLVIVGAPAKVRDMLLSGSVSSTQVLREVRKDPAQAAARLGAGATAAKAAGKTKVTAKAIAAANQDGAAPLVVEVNFGAGDNMGDTLKALAAQIRNTVPHDRENGDAIGVAGKLTLTITLPAAPAAPAAEEAPPAAPAPDAPPADAPKPKRQRKAADAPAAAAAKPKAEPKPKAADAAAKTAAAAVKAGLVPAGGEEDPLAHALGAGAPTDGLADL